MQNIFRSLIFFLLITVLAIYTGGNLITIMPFITTIANLLAIGAIFLPAVRAGYNPLSSNNVVVYWGT